MICYLFLNVLKLEITENLRFLRTNVVSVVALSVFCDDYLIKGSALGWRYSLNAIGANP